MSKSYALAVTGSSTGRIVFVTGKSKIGGYDWGFEASRAMRFEELGAAVLFVQEVAEAKPGLRPQFNLRPVRIIETPGKETRRIVPVEGAPFVTGTYHCFFWGDVYPDKRYPDKPHGTPHLEDAKLFKSQKELFDAVSTAVQRHGKKTLTERVVGVAVTPAEPTITVEEIE